MRPARRPGPTERGLEWAGKSVGKIPRFYGETLGNLLVFGPRRGGGAILCVPWVLCVLFLGGAEAAERAKKRGPGRILLALGGGVC